jgi:hypothetical protein
MLARRFLCLVIALGAAIFVPKDVFACSCIGASFAKRYELSADVFTAVVTDERTERISDQSTLVRHAFTVTRAFKGQQAFNDLVSERHDIVSCGTPLKVGAEYLFFMRESAQVGVCPGPLPKESAGSEIAALEAFTTGRRLELVEPWHFRSYDEGCSLHTIFEASEEGEIGGAMFSVPRPGFASAAARVDIAPGVDPSGRDMALTIDGVTYEPKPGTLWFYTVTGDEAEDIVRKTLAAETFRLRLGDLEFQISTANLADAKTGAQMLECIGPR